VSVGGRSPRTRSAQILCGALAGPLWFTAFTVIGAARRGYDWLRYPVSSLAIGREGWQQRTKFAESHGVKQRLEAMKNRP
jgi:hypothetical protein